MKLLYIIEAKPPTTKNTIVPTTVIRLIGNAFVAIPISSATPPPMITPITMTINNEMAVKIIDINASFLLIICFFPLDSF